MGDFKVIVKPFLAFLLYGASAMSIWVSDNKHRQHGAKLNIKQSIELVCAVALSNLAASAPCHNATLFDLYFAHLTSSLFKPTTTAGGGIASWVASTAALPFPRCHTRIELGQQRCADRKKIETKSNRDRIVDGKIESKSIEIDKAES